MVPTGIEHCQLIKWLRFGDNLENEPLIILATIVYGNV